MLHSLPEILAFYLLPSWFLELFFFFQIFLKLKVIIIKCHCDELCFALIRVIWLPWLGETVLSSYFPFFPPFSLHTFLFVPCAAPCKAQSRTMTRWQRASRRSPAGSRSTWSTTRGCCLSCRWPTRRGVTSTMTAPMLCWSMLASLQAHMPRVIWSDFVHFVMPYC